MRLALSVTMALLIGGVSATSVLAPKELVVLEDCQTIQECINLAEAGDTITVPVGTYTENLWIAKPLTLQAAPGTGRDEVVVQAVDNSRPTVLIQDAREVTVRGLTITGGDSGLFAQSTSMVVVQSSSFKVNREGIVIDPSARVILQENRITASDQDGVVIWGEAQLQDNEILNNGFDGVKILGTAQLSGNNQVSNNGGHGIFVIGSAQITNNTVSGNQLAGIEIWGFAQATIETNEVTGNAHGVVVWGAAQAILSGNELTQNRGDGVLLVDQGQAELRENKILDNGQWGIAMWVEVCHAEAIGWSFLGEATGTDNELSGNQLGDLCGVPETLKKTT